MTVRENGRRYVKFYQKVWNLTNKNKESSQDLSYKVYWVK